MKKSRREFVKSISAGATGIAIGSLGYIFKSYTSILGGVRTQNSIKLFTYRSGGQ